MKINGNKSRGAPLLAPGMDRLICKQEAAERLGVSIRTVERLISAGKLAIKRVGRSVRLRLSQVLSFANIENELIPPTL